MAELIRLQMAAREESGSNATRRLRSTGSVPAVLYGHGQGTVSLATGKKELEIGLARAQFFELEVDGKIEPAVAREVQYDTYGQNVLHVDFVRVDLDEKVIIQVPIILRGTPVGTTKGGVQQTLMNDVQLSASPRNAPESVTLTITDIGVDESRTLADLEIPEGAALVDDPEKVIVMVTPKRESEEDGEVEGDGEGSPTEPEVVGKKSDDDESSDD